MLQDSVDDETGPQPVQESSPPGETQAPKLSPNHIQSIGLSVRTGHEVGNLQPQAVGCSV